MTRPSTHLLLFSAAACAIPLAPASAQTTDPLAVELDRRLSGDVRPLLAEFCVKCHSEEKPKGDIRLDTLTSVRAALDMGNDLATLREMVATRQMPPEDKPQPSDHQRLIVAQWLDAMVAYVPPDAPIDPGWFTIHRLNRAEYRNTLRDLLGIDPAAHDLSERLPRDDTGYGFDNIADVLSVSPIAIEQYLDAAERAVALALGEQVEIGSEARPVMPLTGKGGGNPLPQGGYYLYAAGSVDGEISIPLTGEYLIKLGAWETHAGDENARISLRIDGKERKTFDISGTREEPQEVEARMKLRAGRHRVSAHFVNDFWQPPSTDRNLGVEWISLAGPLEESTTERPARWRTIFAPGADRADENARAGAILSAFAARAYRRPLADAESAGLVDFYRSQRSEGLDFEGAVRAGLTAVLVSPNFLFRTVANEHADDPHATYRLSPHELAARLSYFLWSSTPDDTLSALAASGELSRPEVLREQVRRMLADPKSRAFIDNFAGQWLHLRALDSLALDPALFPEFDDALRADLSREARLFFADALASNRSVLSFIDSDFTFVNDRLAALYGIDGVEGPEFRRVQLGAGSARGGVITMGAVLAVTSNPTRTSPVKRGLYVLDQILGAPPPPPPADIPPLEQARGVADNATLRERFAAHVANPTCAVCHNRLDPIGFSLENFDALGRWRDGDGGKPIDTLGTLPGGETFDGPAALKKVLLARADQFVESLAARVLTYAIGRGTESFDRPAVRSITATTRADGDRFGSLIEAVVLSETFRSCRGRELDHD